MSTRVETRAPFEAFLNQYDESDWAETLISLLPDIHEVDRAATQIWFAFYPLSLHRALEGSEDPEALARKLLMQGRYRLAEQIDSSHTFLYGHRFWTEAKRAVEDYAERFQPSEIKLAQAIRDAAKSAASAANADESLLVGITAVAFMTVVQTGLEAFKEAPGRLHIDVKHARLSPEQVLKARAKDDGQGLFGFLKTVDKKWTVTFDENKDGATFKLINGQDLAWAAAGDKRDYKRTDERRIEGPIPVECRNASCGTCWVGVLGGAEKLAPVSARERRMMREFGYLDTDEERPVIRLSCITPASGAVSIVIPPWNGFFGKRLKTVAGGGEEEEASQTESIA
ncbi:MAG TPA: 2Fe-2S iron-sulfur cluster-binding protein [Pyrinomonadaceae bacterium]|nr:2Fe-2S iron-sulfur cluster-binding protein [Pyrinomonadaceae bacterium]